MNRKLLAVAVATGVVLGGAPVASADDDALTLEVCRAVMALAVNPFDPSDQYALWMLERYPNMTYKQSSSLVETAYRSVMYHENAMCNGVTIPPNY